MIIVLILPIIFTVSFILAWRSLPELEIPEEAKKTITRARKKRGVSGVFLFFRDKILHYSSLESFSSDNSSSSPPDSSEEKITSGLTKE